MSDPARRHAATAGLCAAVLSVAAMAVSGVTPNADASPSELQTYITAQRHGIVIAFALYQIAIVFLFVFFAGLARVVSGTQREGAALAWGGFAGGVGLQFVALAGAIPFVAAAWRGADDAELTLTYDANLIALYALTSGLSAASVLLPTLAGLVTRTLPTWLLLPAIIVIAANAAELVGFAFFENGPMALGAGPGLVAVPVWTLWLAAVSIVLLRQPKQS